MAKRAAGVVAGGDRGESCSVRRSTRSSVATPGWNERALSPTSAPCFGGAIDAPKRESSSARHSTPPTARAPRPLAEHAETELRATGARPRRVVLTGLDSLTASERRIAELASQGLTNREIAQTLFVTARTVEGHLTSVFRKLQLDSRDELPAALAGGAPVPGLRRDKLRRPSCRRRSRQPFVVRALEGAEAGSLTMTFPRSAPAAAGRKTQGGHHGANAGPCSEYREGTDSPAAPRLTREETPRDE